MLLRFGGSVGQISSSFQGLCWQKVCSTFTADEARRVTSCDLAALWTIWTGENGQQWKGHIWLTSFFVLWGKKLSWIATPLWGETNTGQLETHLQMRNKEVCFAYQLLSTSRLAFGCCCCLWFCRCMPSKALGVMDPFPRKRHWNILTVTFAWQ